MKNCIFCSIINSELEAFKVYEDDLVIAILDHRPVREGATMVIPKKHYKNFIDLPNDLAAHITIIGNNIGNKIQKTLNPKRIGFAVAGFGVEHVHYHIIPMHHEHDVTSGVYARNFENEVIFDMKNTPFAPIESQKAILELIKI